MFTENMKACLHVDAQYSEAHGEGLDTPMEARYSLARYSLDRYSLVVVQRELPQ